MFILLSISTFAATDIQTISIAVTNNDVDWCNFQYPDSTGFETGSEFLVFAQVHEPGVTDATGEGTAISAWIGYSNTNNDPASEGWTWAPATYNVDSGANDEYKLDLGAQITSAGTYYVASRFSLDDSTYKYGGYNPSGGGFWDGINNVNTPYTVTVNTAPELALIGNQELTEDTPVFIVLSSTDLENNTITYSASGGSNETIVTTISNDTLFLTPASDFFTTTPIPLTITAEDGHGGSDFEVIDVTVVGVNDNPAITSITDQTGTEGQALTFTLTATDVDNDSLSWSSQNLPNGASFTDNSDGTADFSWTPSYNQAGTYTDIQFIVNDNQGGLSLLRIGKTR